ncbi:MAG: CCA tRNA nucleotidyltransferase [Rhodospirillales bacterium]|nr:CCA tRNA nucleotidyltransferase [Rhodospirillales bacterium]MDE0381335.1 CCA tRNA nucleotidyltransferase [Rhodospirillales bacterium]
MGTVHAPWMAAPGTRAVIDALTANGADVRFVGGCVRDALLGWESRDIDIGTPDPPGRVLALLKDASIETRTVPRGIAHGTVTALAGSDRFEITTLRRDERTDGRHAEVAFTDDWREDAARRDFTSNAMSAAPDGTLYDYFGGQADLGAGRVRFVGDPTTRIAEDHLRILRFFRFHAWYGKGEPDAEALAACNAAAHTIPTLSGERVQAEMLKLLAAPDPLPAIETMRETSVLAQLLPDTPRTDHLARLIAIEGDVGEADSIRRLAVLLADAAGAHDVATRWRLASADATRLADLCAPPAPVSPDLDRPGQRRRLYRLGPALFRDLVLLAWAKEAQGENETAWRAMLETAAAWEEPALPVTGADVLACGVEAGPAVGRLLFAVEAWWKDRDFAPDRADALAKLKELAAAGRPE